MKVVVLAPLGVAGINDARMLQSAFCTDPRNVMVIIPEGRPSLCAEQSGFEVRTVKWPRSVRALFDLVHLGIRLRRDVRDAGKRAVVWVDEVAFAPYDAILKAGSWTLGIRTLRRIRDGSLTVPEDVRFRPVRFLGVVALNISAYRVSRRIIRRMEGVELPKRCAAPIRQLLYVRTDLAFNNSAEPGGTMSHTEGVVGGLIDNGVRVTALSPRPLPISRRIAPEWVRVVPHGVKNIHPELVRAVADLGVEQDLLLLAPKATDAIYTRYSLLNTAALSLAQARHVPLILEFNCSEGKFSSGGKSLIFERLGLKVEAELCRRASLVVVVSNRVADEVRAIAPKARILVSPNAVDAAAFDVCENVRQTERARLAVPDGDVLVGFVGRFYVWHGVDTLADAAERFLTERPTSQLLLVGDGPYRENALRRLTPWGDRVMAPGIVAHEQIPRLMAACDILVAPHAPIEGFVGSPMKLFEYLASGRATIASRLEQLADVIADGLTGVLVTPGSVEELTDAVIRLVDDSELRAELGYAGRREALAKHTWEARVRRILDAVGSR